MSNRSRRQMSRGVVEQLDHPGSEIAIGLDDDVVGKKMRHRGSVPELTFPDRIDTLGGMCRQVMCNKCGKPGWAGCGAHIEQVLGHVPKDERCKCDEAPAGAKKGFLSTLLGR